MCYSKLKNNFWEKEVAWIKQIPCISVLIWVDSSMTVLDTQLKTKRAERPLREVLCFPLGAVRAPWARRSCQQGSALPSWPWMCPTMRISGGH